MERSGTLVFWAYTAAFLGVFAHATSEFFAVLSGIAGPEVSVWRYLIGSLALLLVALARKETRDLLQPLREEPIRVVLLSTTGMALGQLLFHWSLDFASVVQVATLVTTMPILVVVADAVINGNRVTAPKIISGIGAFGGVIFLLTDGYIAQLQMGGESLKGVILAVGCAAIGAVYLVLVRPLIGRYGAIRMTTLTFLLGAIALWTTVGIAWGIWVDPATLFDREPQAYLSILTLGIWNTCLGFILWLWGLATVPDVGRANYLFFLKPVIAALLAVIILGNVITGIQLLAIAVVLGCVGAEIFYDRIRTFLAGLRGPAS